MSRNTHIFSGVLIDERNFGTIPQDQVYVEAVSDSERIIDALLRKYPRIVAYVRRNISARNGKHIYAGGLHNQEDIVWVPGRELLLNDVIKSSNAVGLLDSNDLKGRETYEAVINSIRNRAEAVLSAHIGISESPIVIKLSVATLDRDFMFR